ncbi:uncharacterized protein (DUF885 family) [Undibacterium sp. GrIS 1.8]|uniref:DUF885 domain-containing protein n=2 Tax=unclassified Undibacterium TaxID=2630295 RepID=UPI003398BAA0
MNRFSVAFFYLVSTSLLSATSLPSFAADQLTTPNLKPHFKSDLKPDSKIAQQFKAIYTKEAAWRQAQTGEFDEDNDRGVSPSLPKVGAVVQQAKLVYWSDVMRQLDKINPSALSTEDQINYAVYRAQIKALLNDQILMEYQKPLNADSAFWSDLTYAARKPLFSLVDYRNYLAQLKDVPRYFAENVSNMRAGLQRGFTPPKVTLLGRDASVASVIDAKTVQDTVFYTPFKNMPATLSADQQNQLRAEGIKVIQDLVIPAHKELLVFLQTEYFPKACNELSAESLPDGKAYYQAKIQEFTTLDLSPDQIHQIGLTEMAKIRQEMSAVIQQTGFKGDLPAFLTFLRTDPQFYAKTPQDLLMRAAYIAKKFDGKAANFFGYLPRMRFAITPVPDDQAPFYTSGRGGPGIYLVNTYDLPSRALYSLPALTLHESAPGHAFQMPIAMEQKHRPKFRQGYISAYGEGWALYAERLGTEMGMYETAYESFGMLSYQAWRAARLVVDTGIHAKAWTRTQAQSYLHENTALSEHEIETEVDRYISWPAQALSYFLGEMAIWKARHKAEAALKDKFDLRAFHDTVLQLGSVPLPVLEARIDRFIAEGGKSPYAVNVDHPDGQ